MELKTFNLSQEELAKLEYAVIETSKGKKINSKTEYRKATFSLENFDSSKNTLTGECKIRGHGNTTWQTRELYKKPYLLKLNEPMELLGMNKSRHHKKTQQQQYRFKSATTKK